MIVGLKCQFVIVIVATVDPSRLTTGAAYNQTFNVVLAVQQGSVGVGFQSGLAATTGGLVCGDDDLGVTAVDPRTQSVRREAREHDRMDGADARTGQHGIGGFGDHRQVDDDTVTFAHAHILKDVGHAADTAVQVFIGDVLGGFVGIIGFKDDRGLIATGLQMAVDTVGGDVQVTVFEPFDVNVAGGKRDVLDLGVGLDPVQTFTMFTPECIGVVDGCGVHLLVLFRIDMCLGRKILARGICLIGHCLSSLVKDVS